MSSTGAELLFETSSQRYERGSTIVTSNLPFEDWTQVLDAERLTGAARSADPSREHPDHERR
ncbi:ATP-binding protein [Polymorphobacter megasporae]|uniref:ATP-binding protein n=1 Tax=Glacieibacterium megasporae TaxID=2835787 RepID=UPI00272B32AD|nr:ATP-binding protein [Polymorphobacter megasporae]